MIVANFTTMKPEMAHSRTYEDFSKFLGARPERLGIVSRMKPYEDMTASYLTEAVGNVMTQSAKRDKYSPVTSFAVEWEIEQNQIDYVYFTATPQGDGENGTEICMAFDRRYYEVDDTFIIEDSKQMCMVMAAPVRKADQYWEYAVKLMGGDLSATLDADACYVGARTRWIGNVKQEYHDTGCVKFTSNVEKARTFINEIRCDIDFSSRYEAFEQAFIKLSRGSDANGWEDKIFAWPDKKRTLLNNFMAARNQSLLWQHGTMDVNGKPTISDRQGRPIIAGDGAIPQINRYASKFNFTKKVHISTLNEMLLNLVSKCDNALGNTIAFIVNTPLWHAIQNTMSEYLANHHTDAAYIWSKSAGGNVKVGATYDAYTFAGNTLVFKVDRALDLEYPTKGYGVMIDLTGDKASGRPAIELFTVAGHQFMEDTFEGVGLKNNNKVGTKVAGGSYIMSGYQGIAVYNPYRSAILFEN